MVDMRRSGPPSWRGKLAEDHFHPNNAGYAGIADAFYEKIAGN
jgi:lysophospholipase L1-like esterase